MMEEAVLTVEGFTDSVILGRRHIKTPAEVAMPRMMAARMGIQLEDGFSSASAKGLSVGVVFI